MFSTSSGVMYHTGPPNHTLWKFKVIKIQPVVRFIFNYKVGKENVDGVKFYNNSYPPFVRVTPVNEEYYRQEYVNVILINNVWEGEKLESSSHRV